jgi:hypothetical protein
MIRSIEKFNDLIGSRSRDLPAYRTVPQPTTLPRGPCEYIELYANKEERKTRQQPIPIVYRILKILVQN